MVGACHVQNGQTAEAEPDCSGFLGFYANLLFGRFQSTSQTLLQFGAVFHQWIHEGLVFFNRRAALAFAVHVHSKRGIPQIGNAFGFLAVVIAKSAPCVCDNNNRCDVFAFRAKEVAFIALSID